MELDEAVDGFGAAVAGSFGVEVGQERCAPLLERSAEAGDLGDRTRRQRRDQLLGDPLPLGRLRVAVGQAQLLRDRPGEEDRVVLGAGVDRPLEAGPLPVGEFLDPGAEDGADALERVAFAAAVPEGVLLDAAADLVDDLGADLDDVERVEDGGGVLELVVDGVLVAVERGPGSRPRPDW